jgi:hypothetical protein
MDLCRLRIKQQIATLLSLQVLAIKTLRTLQTIDIYLSFSDQADRKFLVVNT